MKKCAVIGSINMDLVIRVPHFPLPGQTLTGTRFETVPGGKGANQAIALARLGVPVRMVGLVGCDGFGERYMAHFEREGVDISLVGRHPSEPTGIADIYIDDKGENCIVLVPGANAACDEQWLCSVMGQVSDCDAALLQLELPPDTVRACIRRLREMGKTIILDPAPAVPLERELLALVHYVTPNETELEIITGFLDKGAGMEERISALAACGCTVIHKRGSDGAYIGTKEGIRHVPGFAVDVVDTTAAGDTFNAGLAAGLIQGLSLESAVRMANAAGALAVTAFGAQAGMPTMDKLSALMNRKA